MASWIGKFSDPVYGGVISVCVSQIDGVSYGQGFMSEVAYMRGTIAGNTWSGSYAFAGQEAVSGTFTMLLSGSTYSGTFTQEPSLIPLPGASYRVQVLQISNA
jgi:hypothetical protein